MAVAIARQLRMRTPVAKNVKKLSSRSSARRSIKSAAKAKSTRLKPATKRSPAGKARAHKATHAKTTKPVKAKQRPAPQAAKPAKRASKVVAKKAPVSKRTKVTTSKRASPRAAGLVSRPVAPPPPPPQPTRDEAAALKAFEAAHREFSQIRRARC